MKRTQWILPLLFLSTAFYAKNRLEFKSASLPAVALDLTSLETHWHHKKLKNLSFGFEDTLSGILWIELLQHASLKPISQGQRSWESSQLLAITELDPQFEPAYFWGASLLSVFRQDRDGARKLLTSWVERRPQNWRAHQLLGMHLFLEFRDSKGAAEQILTAAGLPGAPEWLRALGIRLLSETGAWNHALELAVNLWPTTRNPEARVRLTERIRALRFHLQKMGWQEALRDFRRHQQREPNQFSELIPFFPRGNRQLATEPSEITDELGELLREDFPFDYSQQKREIQALPPDREKSFQLNAHFPGSL